MTIANDALLALQKDTEGKVQEETSAPDVLVVQPKKKKPKNPFHRNVSTAEVIAFRAMASTALKLAKDSSSAFTFEATFQEPVTKQSNLFKNVRFLIVDFEKLVGFFEFEKLNNNGGAYLKIKESSLMLRPKGERINVTLKDFKLPPPEGHADTKKPQYQYKINLYLEYQSYLAFR